MSSSAISRSSPRQPQCPLPLALQTTALLLAAPTSRRCRRAAPPLRAHFISAGDGGGEAALGSGFEESEVVGSGSYSGSYSGGSGGGGAVSRDKPGWQRRWTMVAMCFVAFMVGGGTCRTCLVGPGALAMHWHSSKLRALARPRCMRMRGECRPPLPTIPTPAFPSRPAPPPQLCNMDRVNMSIAILPISQQYQWTSATIGLVQSSFFWGYLLTQVGGAGCRQGCTRKGAASRCL